MKKFFLSFLLICILPNICFGASARYSQLVREKQRKMSELEQCMGSTKGLKIAGLSTLGLTAVGVAGNIAQAGKRNEYDSKIASLDKKIEREDSAILEKQSQIAVLNAKKAEIVEEPDPAQNQAGGNSQEPQKETECQKKAEEYYTNTCYDDYLVFMNKVKDISDKCYDEGDRYDEDGKCKKIDQAKKKTAREKELTEYDLSKVIEEYKKSVKACLGKGDKSCSSEFNALAEQKASEFESLIENKYFGTTESEDEKIFNQPNFSNCYDRVDQLAVEKERKKMDKLVEQDVKKCEEFDENGKCKDNPEIDLNNHVTLFEQNLYKLDGFKDAKCKEYLQSVVEREKTDFYNDIKSKWFGKDGRKPQRDIKKDQKKGCQDQVEELGASAWDKDFNIDVNSSDVEKNFYNTYERQKEIYLAKAEQYKNEMDEEVEKKFNPKAKDYIGEYGNGKFVRYTNNGTVTLKEHDLNAYKYFLAKEQAGNVEKANEKAKKEFITEMKKQLCK